MIDALPKDYLDNIMGKTPLKRLGDTCGIAKGVLFLASDSAVYATGQMLLVDGGMSMLRRLYHYGTVKRRSISKG